MTNSNDTTGKCPHLDCLVNHMGNPCTCDMARHCPECRNEWLNPLKNPFIPRNPTPNEIEKQKLLFTKSQKICRTTTGKRWWEEKIEKEFSSKFNIAYVRNKGFAFLGREIVDFYSERIAKVEEQAFRKGVEASLGAVPNQKDSSNYTFNDSDYIHDHGFNTGVLESKENIGKLIK